MSMMSGLSSLTVNPVDLIANMMDNEIAGFIGFSSL
tara:strand:- start:156 stop:263 length:108 start_codon:yes stop_codon:yes gene_type:complete